VTPRHAEALLVAARMVADAKRFRDHALTSDDVSIYEYISSEDALQAAAKVLADAVADIDGEETPNEALAATVTEHAKKPTPPSPDELDYDVKAW